MSEVTPSSNPSSLSSDARVPVTSVVADDQINLFELWDTLVQGRSLIIKCIIISLIFALWIAITSTPVYRVEVLLLPVIGEGSTKPGLLSRLGGASELLGIGSQANNSTVFATAKLQSKAFIESFLKEENIIKILNAGRWDEEKQEWKKSKWKSWLGLPDEPPTMWNAVQFFNKILTVTEDKKTGLITLAIEWKDREQAALWANRIVERINLFLRDLAIRDARISMDFLNEEFEKVQVVGVRNAIASLQEAQMKKIMMASAKASYAFDIIDPAIVPPENAYVKPKRLLTIMLGFFGGVFVGILAVFLRNMIRRQKKAATTKS
ncbi:MAG: hypothetical protein G8345_01760 [Magnetococcales bacterium]|nr:hypothetical protein [Magnetococcales bacterium]NGZ25596.1 hypothetical protein [Magnetococcales bacterium]